MTPYIFYRDTGFYPIDLVDDEAARRNAICNPGTIKVENALTNKVVWAVAKSTGIELIQTERFRQVAAEGYTPRHDDEHVKGQILIAAIAYAMAAQQQGQSPSGKCDFRFCRELYWPWDADSWKPADQITNLVKAGALIAAEIDRLQRIG